MDNRSQAKAASRPGGGFVIAALAVALFLGLTPASTRTATAAPVQAGRIAEGLWQGTLQGSLRLIVHITRTADGVLAGSMDSPDQGASGLAIDTLTFSGDSLVFTMHRIGGRYAGRMSDTGWRIDGEWHQGAITLPLSLDRVDHVEAPRRPQEPQRPYPYDEHEVTYTNAAAGITLAGTLTVPRTAGRHPCALLITGSGPENRDEAIFGHRPFLVLADHLTRAGIAVLRVDDRGVGGSTGNTTRATSEDFAADVRAGLEFLRHRPDIDPAHLGLIGHSEGGLIAPMVAERPGAVSFIVLLAGPGVPGDSILGMQSALLLAANGAPPALIDAQRHLQRTVFALVRTEPDSARVAEGIRRAILSTLAGLPESLRGAMGDPEPLIQSQQQLARSPWFRFFLDYDPRPRLSRVRCPVLALNGSKDLQVPPRENLDAIRTALAAGGNRDATVHELPGLNHLFQTATTGTLAEYGRIEETFAPQALDEISRWILAHVAERTTPARRR